MTDAQLLKAACATLKLDIATIRVHRITPQHVIIVADDFRKFTVNRADLNAPAKTRQKKATVKKMNDNVIIAFGRNHAVTSSLFGEVSHWSELQYADLARRLNNADRIFCYNARRRLQRLDRFGFNHAQHQLAIYDYADTNKTLAELLYANNVAYTTLRTATATAAALTDLTGAVLANGVLYLSPVEYITYPARIALCLA